MVSIDGFDELYGKIQRLTSGLEEIKGANSVSLIELFTPDFVSRNTRFPDANALFNASGFKLDTQEEFEAIPNAEIDAFIQSVSSYHSWQEMLTAAAELWAMKRLGF